MVQLDVGSAPYSFTAGGIYVQKIYIDSIKADTTSSDWTYVRWPDNTTADSATYARTTAHRDNVDSAAAIPVTLWSVAETYDSLVVAGQVGANAHLSADGKWVSHRDSIDLQALNDVIYRTTPGYKDSAKHFFEGGTNGYPPLEYLVGANHPDADGNGLPNAFTKRLRNSDTDSTGLAPDSVVGRYGHLAIEAYLWGYFSDVLSIWWQDKTGAEDSTNVLVNGVREDNIAGVAGTGSRFYRGLYEAWSIGDSISFCAWVVADSTCSPPLAIAGDTTKG
ncbi:MAG: hypothetical protein GTO15_11105 [Pseudomonas stutzeri]|nr:hypothetical protein [Stutzerimonas stutzeri]